MTDRSFAQKEEAPVVVKKRILFVQHFHNYEKAKMWNTNAQKKGKEWVVIENNSIGKMAYMLLILNY